MHTSDLLQSSHFRYETVTAHGNTVPATFDDFCPNYHEQDRVGVVSPNVEDGVLHAAYALLACTTTFYDHIRVQRGKDYFTYPQHFGFFTVDDRGVHTRHGPMQLPASAMGLPWSNLDVWPEGKWIRVPDASASTFLRSVFNHQINRLFWPATFFDSASAPVLPAWMRPFLRTHLKSVHLYESDQPDIALTADDVVEEIVRRSIDSLPGWDDADKRQRLSESPHVERFARISPDAFLQRAAHLFEPDA